MTLQRVINRVISVLLLPLVLAGEVAWAERIKDISTIDGVRNNQLIGYGLVVGLDGTGDQTTQTPFTVQSLKNMLARLGVVIPDNVRPQLKNVAAVMVTAELPAFFKPGQAIDVTVLSLGNAKSLRGGSLLLTPMKGVDGQVYVMAQGNLIVSGFGAGGADGSKVTVNVPSAGRIPNGGMVEREVANPFSQAPFLVMNLNTPDFTTAQNMATMINQSMGQGVARPLDAASVEVKAPADIAEKIAFVAMLENLQVTPGSVAARVIINSRTGTVVIGAEVRVSRAAVAHGNLIVSVSENIQVSQPGALSRRGNTAVTQSSDVSIVQEDARMFLMDPGVSLQEFVDAINRVGVAPGDLVAILEALEQVGALRAQLIVI